MASRFIDESEFNYREPNVDLEMFQKGMLRLPSVMRDLGYSGLRPGQDQIIYSVMGGVDTIAVASTAFGKTACMIIPALCFDFRLLIFCPLKSLMRDQVKNLQRQGIVALNISSDNSETENARNISDWVRGDCKILYIAPERLLNPMFMAAMRQAPPQMICVDECFTPDVEIMTRRGFVRFDELLETDYCAQVDPDTGGLGYVIPSKLICRPFQGDLINVSSPNLVDLSMTPNHELLLYRARGAGWKKKTVESAKLNHVWNLRVAASDCEGRDTMTWDERLQVAYQADGNRHSKNTAAFSFKKQRKIERFLWLMKEGNYTYSEVKDSNDGRRRFLVSNVGFLNKELRKSLDPSEFSRIGCREIIEEAVCWDGSVVNKGLYYYSSCVKDNTDFMQEVCLRAGHRSRITKQVDPRSENYNDVWRLFIQLGKEFMGTQKLVKKAVAYYGNVYCVSVPTGCIVVRRNGVPVVVGNCHVLSAWSDNFRSSYTRIGDVIELYNPRVVLAMTATLDSETEGDVRRVVRIPKAPKIRIKGIRHNLKLSSSNYDENNDLVGRVRDIEGSILVYAGTQKGSEETAVKLSRSLGEEVGFYHAGVPEKTKQMYQDSFYDGRTRVMCATNAFGMGIDKPDIRGVIHTMHPGGPQALMQEAGRGGRDGLDCICHTYSSRRAIEMNEMFIRTGHPSKDQIDRFYDALVQKCDAAGVAHLSYIEIEEISNVSQDYFLSISQILRGSRCIEEVEDAIRTHQVKFLKSPEAKKSKEVLKALEELAHVSDEGWSCFDIDVLAARVSLAPTTLRTYLNTWGKEKCLEYVPPPRGKPIKLIGGLDQVDYPRLAKKREAAYAGLAYVKGYFDVKDAHKHQYLEDYFASQED